MRSVPGCQPASFFTKKTWHIKSRKITCESMNRFFQITKEFWPHNFIAFTNSEEIFGRNFSSLWGQTETREKTSNYVNCAWKLCPDNIFTLKKIPLWWRMPKTLSFTPCMLFCNREDEEALNPGRVLWYSTWQHNTFPRLCCSNFTSDNGHHTINAPQSQVFVSQARKDVICSKNNMFGELSARQWSTRLLLFFSCFTLQRSCHTFCKWHNCMDMTPAYFFLAKPDIQSKTTKITCGILIPWYVP